MAKLGDYKRCPRTSPHHHWLDHRRDQFAYCPGEGCEHCAAGRPVFPRSWSKGDR